MMISISYLSRNRPQHLANSLKTVHEQTTKPSKIVVVDCSDDINTIQLVVSDFQQYSKIPFEFIWKPANQLSRSQGRQLGREHVNTSLMISTESDILFPPDIIEQTLQAFGSQLKQIYVQPWICAYGSNGIPGPIIKEHRCGFYQAFRTVDCDAIGGYNPFLKGWGAEDSDFKQRLIAYDCKEVTIPLIVYHQYHTKVASNTENNRNWEITRNTYFDIHTREWKIKQGFKL